MSNTISLQGQQATAGSALKSVLGTVNSVAVAVSSTFDIVTDGVGMAHKFVNDASRKQADRSTVDMDLYRDELLAEAGLRKMKLEDAVGEFVGTDANRQQRWSAIEAKLQALFATPAAA